MHINNNIRYLYKMLILRLLIIFIQDPQLHGSAISYTEKTYFETAVGLPYTQAYTVRVRVRDGFNYSKRDENS